MLEGFKKMISVGNPTIKVASRKRERLGGSRYTPLSYSSTADTSAVEHRVKTMKEQAILA